MDNDKLQLLLDRAEISDVQLRYATGLDSRDWSLFRSIFTDEIETDFSSVFGGEPRRVSSDRWTEAARRAVGGLAATHHMITNHVITVAGDDATCIAYVQARHYLPNDSGDHTQTMFGYYTNRFVRTSAGWRFARASGRSPGRPATGASSRLERAPQSRRRGEGLEIVLRWRCR